MNDPLFDLALGRAAWEASDPALAHWAVGFAWRSAAQARALMAQGQLVCFANCAVGLSGRRVPAWEFAVMKDGSSLVELLPNDPWEAADLAKDCLERDGGVWICLRFGLGVVSGKKAEIWACARAQPEHQHDFDGFWALMRERLAQAEVRALAEMSARGYRADRVAQLAWLGQAARAAAESAELEREAGMAPASGEASRL